MQTAIALHCCRCLALIRRTAFSRAARHSSGLGLTSFRAQPTAAAFSSSQYQQVREAFLRAGPGRELGATFRKPLNHTAALSDQAYLDSTNPLNPAEQQEDLTSSSTATSTSKSTLSSSSSTSKRPSSTSATPQYKEIILLETDFRERFIKGGGNGGQKINKTNSNVELKHFETGIVVQCQATRSLPQNRKLARRILVGRLDEYYNGDLSKRGQKAEKIRQRKMRMARKAAKKYHGAGATDKEDDTDEESDEDDIDGDWQETAVEETDGAARARIKAESQTIPESTIQMTTLEEILATDNKKPSRRKAGRKD